MILDGFLCRVQIIFYFIIIDYLIKSQVCQIIGKLHEILHDLFGNFLRQVILVLIKEDEVIDNQKWQLI